MKFEYFIEGFIVFTVVFICAAMTFGAFRDYEQRKVANLQTQSCK